MPNAEEVAEESEEEEIVPPQQPAQEKVLTDEFTAAGRDEDELQLLTPNSALAARKQEFIDVRMGGDTVQKRCCVIS